MRVPQSWLTDVLDIDAEPTAEQIDEAFVRVGFEIEDVEPFGHIAGPLVVGRVETIEELTEFKKPIRFCLVAVGEDAPREIVCGARNFTEGDLVVVALPGTTLPGGFEIASRKTYGKTSDGMICSVTELGVGDDHTGILVLPSGSAEPGDDARTVLGLPDTAIDVNVTPDRGYAFSVRGLGRELAGSLGAVFREPGGDIDPGVASDGGWPVAIDPATGSTRYTARVVESVDPTAASPWWLRKRLLVAGIRPISAVVDITNYVMIELGQPLHAFDADRVRGDIAVRNAKAGEKLTTLDGVERALDAEDVVIADDSGPIALAGVMGGAVTEVGDETTRVLLESATFDPVRVFRTGKRHKLTSEASKRFERTVDPEITAVASARAAQLIVEIAGGALAPEWTDVRLPGTPTPVIDFAADAPDRTAGIEYPAGTSAKRLREVGCLVEESGDRLLVTPPSWRPDLRQSADLVEEVLRLEGLEDIPAVVPRAPGGRGLTPAQRRRRSIGRALALDGFVEVLPYPFMPAGVFDTWGLDEDDPRRATVKVLNPLEADRPELNTTLLPGLLEMAGRNIARGQRDLSLFTIGQVVLGGPPTEVVGPFDVTKRPTDEELARVDAALPEQPLHVAVVLTGLAEPAGPWGNGRPSEAADAFEAARSTARAAGADVELVADDHLPWHPGRCAKVVATDDAGQKVTVGWAGELHPAVCDRAHLPKRTCAVELSIDALPLRTALPAPSLSVFPAVLQDVAVVVDDTVPSATVAAALREGAGELLESLDLFDVYTGDQVGDGKKSLAFALRFRAPDRTLTEDEASAAKLAAVEHAGSAVGARLR
ncbi:phenylalanyl-tRNA synthetase beta chain [Gordonia araii NBRC 100433]|uniref:Phenylalanine--tRNA ligase beta subunit n=1 Tax=Gordonia araii NBRC 100433 TaxID=1073574 RepID=G7H4P3_9ACTN|nr:phenylalanine--tRNA ligase subunit beta [Gordonia araii]NNG98040.1 phenylalanine--tRNA ligase subunit beta [Gordonia araii NBRC 100433]GAB10818.1 phenylalanyl-tRNA synthetase beta chain [Gordonia araii NBRC 100433]